MDLSIESATTSELTTSQNTEQGYSKSSPQHGRIHVHGPKGGRTRYIWWGIETVIGGRDRSRNSKGVFNATQGLREPFSEKIENRKALVQKSNFLFFCQNIPFSDLI